MGAVPVRMLNEVQYCPRLFHLMHVQGLFEESADMIEGSAQHDRAQQRLRKGEMAPADLWGEAPLSLHLGDDRLQLVGKLDAVKLEEGNWVPVEGKHSSAPETKQSFIVEGYELSGAAWPNDQIQLCALGLLLRANGYESNYGFLYYRGNKKKIHIEFTESLVGATLHYVKKARLLVESEIPKPLVDSNKCFRCSLNYICMPDETNHLLGKETAIRRIIPSRSDGGILYVSEPGTKLGVTGESLVITSREGIRVEQLPVKDLVHLSLMGNVQCSTQLIHLLMQNGVTISYLSTHGRLIGMTSPLTTKNVRLRQQQFLKFQHPEFSLRLARNIVYAKIANQRTLLRRNGNVSKQVLAEMKDLRDKALEAGNGESLRGLEGRAARLYMGAFSTMLKTEIMDGTVLMNGRNRRPPKDPINAMLSLGYTLLVRDLVTACASVGFDPLFGFFHSMEAGRPALALDLMEAFRPLIVDSVVIRAWNTKEVALGDFYIGQDSCQLKKAGRNAFFGAYERRMHEELMHPNFGYRISYRRTLDLETRLLARFIEGDLPEFRPLMTR